MPTIHTGRGLAANDAVIGGLINGGRKDHKALILCWNGEPTLQQEFASFDNFAAYIRAMVEQREKRSRRH